MLMDKPYVYVGRMRACGCPVSFAIDDGGFLAHLAESVATMLASGLIVERIELKPGGPGVHPCIHGVYSVQHPVTLVNASEDGWICL